MKNTENGHSISVLARRVADDVGDCEAAEMLCRLLLRAGHGPSADQVLAQLSQRAPAKALVIVGGETSRFIVQEGHVDLLYKNIEDGLSGWLRGKMTTAVLLGRKVGDFHVEVFGDLGERLGSPVEVVLREGDQ